MDEWIKKIRSVHMWPTEYYLAFKERKKNIETVWMDLEDIMISGMKVTGIASFLLD